MELQGLIGVSVVLLESYKVGKGVFQEHFRSLAGVLT